MVRFLLAYVLAALTGLVNAGPPRVEDFLQPPTYSYPKLSPDGQSVAFILRGNKHDGLAVLDVDTKRARPITNIADADIIEFHWVNNRRLVFNTADHHKDYARVERYGWFAVDADGSHLLEIKWPRPDANRFVGFVAPETIRYLDRYPGGKDDIVVEVRIPEFLQGQRLEDHVSVWRYDTSDGSRVEELSGAELVGVQRWVLDRRGLPRIARTYQNGRQKIWYRPDARTPWHVLEDAEETKLSFFPGAFDFDNETLYVFAYGDGDKLAVYRYDLAHHRLGERLARHPDVDMYSLIFSRGQRRLLGFKYDADRFGVAWIDEHMLRVQRAVDRALPNTVNMLSVADDNPDRVLVTAESDVVPETFYLFDAAKFSLQKLSSSRPWINSAEMAERKFVRYKARDGLDIPAYLTIPRGSAGKKLPLLVEVHSGPWSYKRTWDFDLGAELFASRGYAVLQPEFRGTRGYGKHHFEASFRQWGYAMEDDITDGVQWAIAQGIADKNRVCIFGFGYGGYAALWGLMKTPELFQCGVALAAYSDVSAYFTFNRWDWGRAVWSEYGARTLIGDPIVDADRLQAVSPIAQAARLKAPVLIAHGGFDQRVPLKTANALRAALDKNGKSYEWVEYPEEGHGFSNEENMYDFYRRVDAFLKKYLAEPATQH